MTPRMKTPVKQRFKAKFSPPSEMLSLMPGSKEPFDERSPGDKQHADAYFSTGKHI